MLAVKEHQFLAYIRENLAPNDIGNPEAVLKLADEFGRKQWLMAVGDTKGGIIDDVVRVRNPKVMIELGCYCGYSATRFARLLQGEDSHYYSFEMNEVYADIARQIFELAGLSHKITIITGPFEETFRLLSSTYNVQTVDLVFIDHAKDRYLHDLLLLQNQSTYLKPGTIIVADNIIKPGVPDYLEYAMNTDTLRSRMVETEFEYTTTGEKDALVVSEVL
ncbi:catechol O-methyltransferase [Fimicolochytrium jonesii]|uniref:catechol O-methyltransferase n=1 Tax=Fimicolochytrium jonesii TaxID=1396493 RepID=UPI0022FDDD28|nr:catechol O-methyltransferase [Fimicolochytrium jonesii]KAI8825577.1 catechol O-methyltransferase [Fimicolochytrium jonesii]